MVRIRLLVYKGDERWLNRTKENEYVKEDTPVNFGANCSIESKEIDTENLNELLNLIQDIENILEK